jgi:hypothetical protein
VTAEPIAEVIADIRAGRVRHHVADPIVNAFLLDRAQREQPVVDASAIYKSMLDRATTTGVNLYGDFPTTVSPWDDALIAYVNTHENVWVLQVHQEPWSEARQWDTDNEVDWGRVRWLVETSMWIGGRGGRGRKLATQGPLRLLQHAVYEDGSPADMHWLSMLPGPDGGELWEMPSVVLNASLNFLACSNVEVAEPKRPFPLRQRLRKTRVQVQEIVVRPPGKRRQSTGSPRAVDALDTPLTSVRGHFSHYGEQYGRGLLFGKLAGKFWIPAHARGQGEAEQRDYMLKPESAA